MGWIKSRWPPNSRQKLKKIIFPLQFSRGSWCMDLPNNADNVLSLAQNLQVITIHNHLCCMDVLCTWVKLLTYFYGESCPRLDVVHPGGAWPSSPSCTWHCSLHYLFLHATPLFPHGVTIVCLLPCFDSVYQFRLYSSFVKNPLLCFLCRPWDLQNLCQF